MGLLDIVMWVLFGAVAGWVASLIMGTDHQQGALGNIVIGIVGAFLGGVLAGMLGEPGVSGFNLGSLLVAILGAVILLFAIRLFTRGGTDQEV